MVLSGTLASKLVQKSQQLAVCPVSAGPTVDRGGPSKHLLPQRQISVEVYLSRLDRFVTEPQGDGRLFDASMKQVHSRSMTQAVKSYPLLAH